MSDTLKLYYAPGACSLVDHIILAFAHERGGPKYEIERVDLKTHKTETGKDYYSISKRGDVPALEIQQGAGVKPIVLTQNAAISTYLGETLRIPHLHPKGALERARLLEALCFCGDLHAAVGKLFRPAVCADDRKTEIAKAHRRLKEFEEWLPSNKRWWLGSNYTQADLYAAVVLTWALEHNLDLSPYPKARKILKQFLELPETQKAFKAEGLSISKYTL